MSYELIDAVLRGGPRDGLELTLIVPPSGIVSLPRIELRDAWATPITSTTVKRHSWDEDSLVASLDYYQRTAEIVNGCIVFKSTTGAPEG